MNVSALSNMSGLSGEESWKPTSDEFLKLGQYITVLLFLITGTTLKFDCCHHQMNDIKVWLRCYKTILMLTSAEHEIYPAHKC